MDRAAIAVETVSGNQLALVQYVFENQVKILNLSNNYPEMIILLSIEMINL